MPNPEAARQGEIGAEIGDPRKSMAAGMLTILVTNIAALPPRLTILVRSRTRYRLPR